jgi:TLD
MDDLRVLDEGFGHSNYTLTLKYKASRDGFKAEDFHRMCDGLENTLSVIESSHGTIFGGFASIPWTKTSYWVRDPKTWIFSLTHKTVHRQYFNREFGVFHHPSHLNTFNDFYINNDSSIANSCTSNFGDTHKPPAGIAPGSAEAHMYLIGSTNYKFNVKENEVYQVSFH